MRDLKNFTAVEWLKLTPLHHAIKQWRNDLMLLAYRHRQAVGEQTFLADCARLRGRNIALVIAFEQPWALDWLLAKSKQNLQDCTVLVFDNSLRREARAEIAAVCAKHGTPYLSLPSNRTLHVNRSHGLAMSWVFHRIVRAIEPATFAFLDHDLIPVLPMQLEERLGAQDCFGLINDSAWAWQLWAGYCLFRYAKVRDLPMNFLYDFSRGLDTGGRNWPWLYRHLEHHSLRFAENTLLTVANPVDGERREVQVVDGRWVHIGGISYNNNADAKRQFFENLASAIDQGKSWEALSAEN